MSADQNPLAANQREKREFKKTQGRTKTDENLREKK
jgi:hypothetical protein